MHHWLKGGWTPLTVTFEFDFSWCILNWPSRCSKSFTVTHRSWWS